MLFYDIKLRIITSFFPIFDIKIVSSTDSLINLSFFFFFQVLSRAMYVSLEIHELKFTSLISDVKKCSDSTKQVEEFV